MQESASGQVEFQYISRNRPVVPFDWSYLPAAPDAVDPVWRMVVSGVGGQAAAQEGLAQRLELAGQWEAHAQAVAQAVGDAAPWQEAAVGGQSAAQQTASQDLADIPTDAAAGLYDYVAGSLRQPLIVETIVAGVLLARTTVRWPNEQDTVWDEALWATAWAEVHLQAVSVAGRTALAVLGREAVATAVRRAQEQGADGRAAWAAVQQLAGSVPRPKLPTYWLAAPSPNTALPHIVASPGPLAMTWCWVPGGEFAMGDSVEKPNILQRTRRLFGEKVTEGGRVLVDGFWLARYPVTNAQYRLFMEAGGYDRKEWWTESGWRVKQQENWTEPLFWRDRESNGAQHPVIGVSWYEAAAFCAWATETTGEKIHLSTEAEWEKGARGLDGRNFPWGETEPNEKMCNFDRQAVSATPVGQYSPQGDSPYGCADMAGNVWEWCQSKKATYPYKANDRRNDEAGTDIRMLRGGSWGSVRDDVRSTFRDRNYPYHRDQYVGFRCASTAF